MLPKRVILFTYALFVSALSAGNIKDHCLTSVLGMILNHLKMSLLSWSLVNAEYHFITITLWSTLIRICSTCYSPIYGSNKTVQSFTLIIIIIISHLKPYSFEFYILICRIINDTIIKTQEDFFIKICTSHFIVRVRKGLLKVCVWEGAGDRTETAIFWPHSYGRQRCVFLVFLMLNRRPRGPLCSVMAFFTASYQPLLWTPIQSGAPSPFSLVWLSLPHLVYNSVRSLTETVWLLSWLSYIIVQRPLSRLLDLWNSMLDRRQAEITVMQFRGPHFISQFPPTRFPLITALECVTSFRCITLEWHFWPGRRSKYMSRLFLLRILDK